MLTKHHIEAVRQKFPQLRPVLESWWFVIWEGRLMGFDQPYTIRIVWTRFSPWDHLELGSTSPRIYVVDPPLQDRENERVPHMYYQSDGSKPYLCLYDPKAQDWEDDECTIADTLIPWASEWLATYELWRVTGKWLAPGRHPEVKKECKTTEKDQPLHLDHPYPKI